MAAIKVGAAPLALLFSAAEAAKSERIVDERTARIDTSGAAVPSAEGSAPLPSAAALSRNATRSARMSM